MSDSIVQKAGNIAPGLLCIRENEIQHFVMFLMHFVGLMINFVFIFIIFIYFCCQNDINP